MKVHYIKHTPMKILLEPVYFQYFWKTLRIPSGFCFDGASVPSFLSWIFPINSSDYLQWALEHDFLYSQICSENNRRLADKHYVAKMKPFFRKKIVYFVLWLFGKFSYKEDDNYNRYAYAIQQIRADLWFNTHLWEIKLQNF